MFPKKKNKKKKNTHTHTQSNDKATPFSVCNGAAKTEERCEKAGASVKGRSRLEVARGYKLLDLLSRLDHKSRQKPLDGHWPTLRRGGLCREPRQLTSSHHPGRRVLDVPRRSAVGKW